MNKKIETKELIKINPTVNVDIDETFYSLLQKAFVWANEMGLKGVKVTPFNLVKGSEEPGCHPADAVHVLKVGVLYPKGKESE